MGSDRSASGGSPAAADRPEPMGRLARVPAWLPILLVALLVRLPALSTKPLWYDEAFAVLLAAKGPAALLESTLTVQDGVAADVHPPGYYVLLWGWGRLLGTSPWSARLLSVLLGLGTVAIGYRLARDTLGGRTAGLAGWMLALAPFQVHYAQEVRMYGLLALQLVAAAAVYRSALRQGGLIRWLGFAALASAAQYTHSLAALFLLPLALIPIWRRRWRDARRTAASGAFALLLYTPWLLHLPSQIARVRQAYWIAPSGPAEFIRTLVIYVGGSPLPAYALPVVLFSVLLLMLLGGWALLRGLRRGEAAARVAAWAAYLAVAPLVLMLTVSLWQPVYLDRAMLPGGVAFLFWIAWALGSSNLPARMRWTGLVLLVASFGLGLAGYYTYRGFPYAPFDDLVARLRSSMAPGEIVLHSNKLSAIPAAYYGPDLEQRYLPDLPGSASDTLAVASQRVLGLEAETDIASAVGDAPGVWFVVFRRERKEYADLGYSQHPGLDWLQARYSWKETVLFGELELHHFQGPPSRAAVRRPSVAAREPVHTNLAPGRA